MSFLNEQQEQEYIKNFLQEHGTPAKGTIHVVTKGSEAECVTETLDEMFCPESAVVLLIPKGGTFMDGQCYDSEGYKVYAD